MDTKQLLEAAETIRTVKALIDSTPNPWIPVVAAIGGALVGGLSSIVPAYILDHRKHSEERKNVTTALLAEISGILAIMKQRLYLEQIKEAANRLRANPGSKLIFRVKIPSHYSRVYQAYIDRLGVVDPYLASKIIEFHQLVDAIVQDVAPGGPVADEGGGIEAFDQIIAILEAAISIGTEITDKAK